MDGKRIDYPGWLASLHSDAFDALACTAEQLLAIHQALANDGLSILHELLRDRGEQAIEHWAHYPQDDCDDPNSGAMFYYHAHDSEGWEREEHGHFHLFIRPGADDEYAHLMAVSMTAHGLPSGLFATNRWVTDESMLSADSLLERVDQGWEIARARPSWMLSQWLSGLVKLVRPHTRQLLRQRDQMLDKPENGHASGVCMEDRSIHVLSEIPLDLMQILADVQNEAHRRIEPDRPSCAGIAEPMKIRSMMA